jgi:hypothetical protein
MATAKVPRRKKNQKNLSPSGYVLAGQPEATPPNGQKFFASFFQKRRRLLPFLPL